MQMNFGFNIVGKMVNPFVPIATAATSNIIVPMGVTSAVIVTNATRPLWVQHSKIQN